MSSNEKIDLSHLLHQLRNKIRNELVELKTQYPLFSEYFDTELNKSEKLYKEIHTKSPVLKEEEAVLFLKYSKINQNISRVKTGNFSYLWDEKLGNVLQKAIDCKLDISNNWVKTLIVSNILEMALNEAILLHSQRNFKDLRDATLFTKMEEVNEILKEKDLNKLNTMEFEFIKSARRIVDHPISEVISDIDNEKFPRVLEYVSNALETIKPLLVNSIQSLDPNFEAIINPKKIRRGEIFHTKVRFKGKLEGGFFDNKIIAPHGTSFPSGSKTWWCWDKKIHPGSGGPGNLKGEGEWESEWPCKIGENYPVGKYMVYIGVWDHYSDGSREPIKEKKEILQVIE